MRARREWCPCYLQPVNSLLRCLILTMHVLSHVLSHFYHILVTGVLTDIFGHHSSTDDLSWELRSGAEKASVTSFQSSMITFRLASQDQGIDVLKRMVIRYLF